LNRQGAKRAKRKMTATAKAQRRKGTQRKTQSEVLCGYCFSLRFLRVSAPLRSSLLIFASLGVLGAMAVPPE
jgi:hypothetical protein